MSLSSPGPTLGVVGGGQLGRMMAEAAGPLGIELIVADPTPDCPAAALCRDQLVGGFDDEETFRQLAERVDYLTFEIELVDPDALERVQEETGTPVHPTPETLRIAQDKLLEKQTMEDAGVPVPAYRRVDSLDDLYDALDALGYPAMLKAREGGYDGRGNVPIESPDEVEAAYESIDGPALLEEFVDFEREVAVVGCRGVDETDTFPVTETIHEEEILRQTVSPARTSDAILERAREVASDVLDVLDGRGVFGIELFETTDGEILYNEVAPRPHNSGHWTIEGAHTSQFAQHVRAVTGLPLGNTDRRTPTVTTNILGDVAERQSATLYGYEDVLAEDRLNLHWYGKEEVYELRKMGHTTLVGDADVDATELVEAAAEATRPLTFQES
ncbi:5-(carboxyamino)imidazole ribonucleotide synthase [Haloarculaceae archaeon H-GB1-1]|nr:5-(carboxyamino)imidazole ribonucleotide synthase [Haloarculaceae archaeon H-GB1-1]